MRVVSCLLSYSAPNKGQKGPYPCPPCTHVTCDVSSHQAQSVLICSSCPPLAIPSSTFLRGSVLSAWFFCLCLFLCAYRKSKYKLLQTDTLTFIRSPTCRTGKYILSHHVTCISYTFWLRTSYILQNTEYSRTTYNIQSYNIQSYDTVPVAEDVSTFFPHSS